MKNSPTAGEEKRTVKYHFLEDSLRDREPGTGVGGSTINRGSWRGCATDPADCLAMQLRGTKGSAASRVPIGRGARRCRHGVQKKRRWGG